LRISYSNGVVYVKFCKTLLIMERLMSHSDYEDSIDLPSVSDIEFRIKSRNHRVFLKQPLSIGMFVPCDLDGNVLMSIDDKEQYFRDCYDGGWWNQFVDYKVLYQQAKERCLFEGNFDTRSEGNPFVRLNNLEFHLNGLTIERLVGFNLKLTATALKKL